MRTVEGRQQNQSLSLAQQLPEAWAGAQLVDGQATVEYPRFALIPAGSGGNGCRTAGAHCSHHFGFACHESCDSEPSFFLPIGIQLATRVSMRGPATASAATTCAGAIPSRSRKDVRDQSPPTATGRPSTITGTGTCGEVGAIPVSRASFKSICLELPSKKTLHDLAPIINHTMDSFGPKSCGSGYSAWVSCFKAAASSPNSHVPNNHFSGTDPHTSAERHNTPTQSFGWA